MRVHISTTKQNFPAAIAVEIVELVQRNAIDEATFPDCLSVEVIDVPNGFELAVNSRGRRVCYPYGGHWLLKGSARMFGDQDWFHFNIHVVTDRGLVLAVPPELLPGRGRRSVGASAN